LSADPRIAALAEALQVALVVSNTREAEAEAAAILAALPPDWCADPKWQEQYYEGYFGVLGLRADIARLRADNDHLRFIISFHNLTPTGQQRECDPKCIACAALEEDR
jgi:hypothetical protein